MTNLVCLQVLSLDGQRHVGEGFRVQQLVEHGQHVGLVVVPPEAESLGRHGYQLCVCYVTSSCRNKGGPRPWRATRLSWSLFCYSWFCGRRRRGEKNDRLVFCCAISSRVPKWESSHELRYTHLHRENISPLAGDTQFPSKPVPGRTTKTNKRARIHPLVIWQRAL